MQVYWRYFLRFLLQFPDACFDLVCEEYFPAQSVDLESEWNETSFMYDW